MRQVWGEEDHKRTVLSYSGIRILTHGVLIPVCVVAAVPWYFVVHLATGNGKERASVQQIRLVREVLHLAQEGMDHKGFVPGEVATPRSRGHLSFGSTRHRRMVVAGAVGPGVVQPTCQQPLARHLPPPFQCHLPRYIQFCTRSTFSTRLTEQSDYSVFYPLWECFSLLDTLWQLFVQRLGNENKRGAYHRHHHQTTPTHSQKPELWQHLSSSATQAWLTQRRNRTRVLKSSWMIYSFTSPREHRGVSHMCFWHNTPRIPEQVTKELLSPCLFVLLHLGNCHHHYLHQAQYENDQAGAAGLWSSSFINNIRFPSSHNTLSTVSHTFSLNIFSFNLGTVPFLHLVTSLHFFKYSIQFYFRSKA